MRVQSAPAMPGELDHHHTEAGPGALSAAQLGRALWISRLYYFGFFAALGAIVPFFNVYLTERGLSAPQIGIMASVPPFVALAANPFWGAVSDRWQVHRRVMAFCALFAGLVSFAFIWVDQFFSILLFLCLLNFFRSPISAILDSTVMGLIAANPQVSYGRQRVFGSFGWIAASLTVGYLVGQVSIYATFVIHGVMLGLLCSLLSLQLPVQNTAERVNYSEGLRGLLRLPVYRSLLVVMLLFGAGAACIINFTALNILRLGGTAALIGYANASAALLEIPVMFLGAEWARRVNRRNTIVLAMCGFAMLWTAVGFTTNPWLIPLLMMAHGVFFALLWTAVVGFAHAMAPDGLRASAQTISQAAQGGAGWALGSFISGFLWAWNPPFLFFGAAAMALTGAIVFAASTHGKAAAAG